MTIATWPSGPLPVLGDEQTVFYRTKQTSFGDGYKEISFSGINTKIKKGNVLFRAITTTQKNIYANFLDSKGGVIPFAMVLPGDDIAFPTIILVNEYKTTTIGGFYWEFSFNYTQFFPASFNDILPDEVPENSILWTDEEILWEDENITWE